MSISLPPPSRGRYKVLAFLCVLALILYIDRICISAAVPNIEADLGISHSAMSFVLAAFTAAYCLFEVPTGSWGDRYGSRGVMARIVLWWSVFTALTGAALGLWSLLLVRFLFGAGEAGAFPNTARILGRWFPTAGRGPAQGLVNTTALVGGAISPAAAAYLITVVGWRWAFAIFSLPGVVWAIAFYWWFRDNPAAHPAVNDAECQLIGATGNRRVSRCGLGCSALTLAVVFLLAGQHTDDPVRAAGWTALAMFALHSTLPNWWGAVTDVSGRHLGALFGLMNSIGGLGAIASQLFLGHFVDWMGGLGFVGRAQWDPAFYLYAGILLAGAFGWLWIDVTRPVEPVTVPVPVPEPPPEVVTAILAAEHVHGLRE